MGVGQDWVCFNVEQEYGGEEDEVVWPHRLKKKEYGENSDAGEGGWQAAKWQTCYDLMGFKI